MHIPQEPVYSAESLKPALSPFNLHSVLSCDQKAGGQEECLPRDSLYSVHQGWPCLEPWSFRMGAWEVESAW